MLLSKKRLSTGIVLTILFFSLYVTPEISVGSMKIPYMVPYLLFCLGVLLQLVQLKIDKQLLRGFLLIVTLSVLCVFIVPKVGSFFTERLTGAIQLILSFSLFAFLLRSVKHIDIDIFLKALISFLYFLLIIVFVERLGFLNQEFDIIREFLYANSLYVGYERDLIIYGYRRPMGLMKEPAHLAWLSALLLFAIYRMRALPLVNVIVIGLLFMILISSPIILLFFLAIGLDKFMESKKNVFFLFVFGSAFLIIITKLFFFERLDGFSSGTDISFLSRVLGPPIVAFNVIKDYPLFGLGLTADTLTSDYVYRAFFNFADASALNRLDDEILAKRVTNYFFLSFVYMGLVGVLIFYFTIYSQIKGCLATKKTSVILLQFMLFSLGMGGIVTAKVFVALFLLSFIYYYRETKNQ